MIMHRQTLTKEKLTSFGRAYVTKITKKVFLLTFLLLLLFRLYGFLLNVLSSFTPKFITYFCLISTQRFRTQFIITTVAVFQLLLVAST